VLPTTKVLGKESWNISVARALVHILYRRPERAAQMLVSGYVLQLRMLSMYSVVFSTLVRDEIANRTGRENRKKSREGPIAGGGYRKSGGCSSILSIWQGSGCGL